MTNTFKLSVQEMSKILGVNYWYSGASLQDSKPVPNGALGEIKNAKDFTTSLNEQNKDRQEDPFTSIRIAFTTDSNLLKDSELYASLVKFVDLRDGVRISGTTQGKDKEPRKAYIREDGAMSHTV